VNKRRIALFLILSVLLGAMVATAAEPLTDIEDNPHKEAIEQMVELGVLAGRGGGLFYPEDNLTRAEAAKVAMYLSGFNERDAAQAAALPPAFDDVYAGMGAHEWALGWINLAAREGIIEGHGDGKYGPGENLQMAQWAAILIRILGYETGELKWPTGYDELAADLGLTEGLEYVSNYFTRRGHMAEFTANAVFKVELPDGSSLLDILKEQIENRPEEPEEPTEPEIPEEPEFPKPKSINVFFDVPDVIPEGGGRVVTFTATATDQNGNPVKGVKIKFDASIQEPHDRDAQFSQLELLTDANGKATVTYTNRARDSKKMLNLNLGAFNNEPGLEYHKEHKITIANETAVVRGTVQNPFTGAPRKDFNVNFHTLDGEESVGWATTDEQGRYSAILPTGSYRMGLVLGYEGLFYDSMIVHATTAGKTYTMNYNKGIVKGVLPNVSPGNSVIAMDWSVFDYYDEATWNIDGAIQKDGSFLLVLPPKSKAYELFIVGDHNPFATGVSVKTGEVNDIGTFYVYW
jgi:hypothetical protein